jgi:hypothetical protein
LSQKKPKIRRGGVLYKFDSTLGLFHYLVFPTKDSYILNSLVKLNFEEFMYRLLRENGYNRAISFELKPAERKYTIYAYDRLSYYSYMRPKVFKAIPLSMEQWAQNAPSATIPILLKKTVFGLIDTVDRMVSSFSSEKRRICRRTFFRHNRGTNARVVRF